mgnify:CR=1 FL=1
MEITQIKSDQSLIIRLVGRLDASWSETVRNEFSAAVRSGEHHITLEMAEVDYISSAGLGTLLILYKELLAIKGDFGISTASPFVESALNLAGLSQFLIPTGEATGATKSDSNRSARSPQATYEVFTTPGPGLRLAMTGDPDILHKGAGPTRNLTFGPTSFAFGIGALGEDECEERFGEFLAVAGTAVFQPTDGANRPDFVVRTGDFLPRGCLAVGLIGEGEFPLLARFEATAESRTVGLSELATTALELSGAESVAITAIVETAGLVGTALRQSPARNPKDARLEFPQIRDWLAFSNERVFRDATALLAGVVAREGSSLQPLLRPIGPGLFGHFHAAAFPYRPVQKGRIALEPSVTALFENNTVHAVLHLLNDDRGFTGAGESEFLRGALWIAPIEESEPSPFTTSEADATSSHSACNGSGEARTARLSIPNPKSAIV